MFMTKFHLDLSTPAIRVALWDAQRMHQIVTTIFNSSRKDSNILYRINYRQTSAYLYTYSDTQANRELLPVGVSIEGERDITEWKSLLTAGKCVKFDLIASPSKKVKIDGVSKRRLLESEAERFDWLARKGSQYGFELLRASESQEDEAHVNHPADRGGQMSFRTFHYTGILRIVDGMKFQTALATGIGPGKAYGSGMMLLQS